MKSIDNKTLRLREIGEDWRLRALNTSFRTCVGSCAQVLLISHVLFKIVNQELFVLREKISREVGRNIYGKRWG